MAQGKSRKPATKSSTASGKSDKLKRRVSPEGHQSAKGRGKSGEGGGIPPSSATAGGSGDGGEYQRCREETLEKIDRALAKADLSDARRQKYKRVIWVVLDQLTPTGLQRIHQAVEEYKFYPSFEAQTKAIRKKYPQLKLKKGGVLKGMFDRDRTLHLNGGGMLFGRVASLEEFYAHELTHALDGPHHEISESREWQEAWGAEIRDLEYLGENATRSPQEGFSEFGSLLLGSGIAQRDIRQVLPRCLKVWKERVLV